MNVYRNESLVQMETYESRPAVADELVSQVRDKWALLRQLGYAGDYPVEVLRSNQSSNQNGGSTVKVIEVFRWRSAQDRVTAQSDPDVLAMSERLSSLTLREGTKEIYTQAVRGFNKNFPNIGGVELLKGVCSCLLSIDGLVQDYQIASRTGSS